MRKSLPNRKSTRLKDYDYSKPGAYFITICTYNRKQVLSEIDVGQGLAPAENRLSVYGRIVQEQIESLTERYPFVEINQYVIMPNHIHLLISNYEVAAGASPCPTISDVICTLKSISTRLCRRAGYLEAQLFQTSFHDHIIRDECDYRKISEYIETNPLKWEMDCFYQEH